MPVVLIVDDEADIRDVLELSLEHAGYRVLTAADGVEALRVLAGEIPDAMLLDIGMPNIDGWQVLEQIKASGTVDLNRVPVIMLTAWATEDDRLRGGIEGAVRYLAKPFDPNHVIDVLAELLGPDAPSEPELRRKVQQTTLEKLARRERGGEGEEFAGARVRLTKLDRPAGPVPPETGLSAGNVREFLDRLPSRQRQVVESILSGARVTDVARELDVSRSNVYALLRRVAKRADLPDGRTLLHRLRQLSPRP